MKKLGLFFLCLLLFVAVVGGCGAYLYMTPRGVLRPDGPDAVMQSVMDSTDRAKWRSEYIRMCPVRVTEFEDAEKVKADYLVTRDAVGFERAKIPHGTASDFMEFVFRKTNIRYAIEDM